MNNDLEASIKKLRHGYIYKLRDTHTKFHDVLNTNPIDIAEVYIMVHTISGTCGMYGLSELSNVSTEFEFFLKPLKESPETINHEELKTKLIDYVNYLKITLTGD